MAKEIKWHIDNKFSIEIVNNLEEFWGVKFPKKYVSIVTEHDGAQPEIKNEDGRWYQGIIHIPNWHGKFAGLALLRYTNSDVMENIRVVTTYDAFKDCLPEPKKIFPFATDGAGNIFFFDYRNDEDKPSIVFLDHETAMTEEDLVEDDLEDKSLSEWLDDNLYLICNSFEELLDLIYPME